MNKRKIRKLLNDSIDSSLYGGGGDAGYQELNSAMVCYRALQELGLDLRMSDKKDVLKTLGGGNSIGHDFLSDPIYK